jgi:hypothetical protein
LSSRTTVATAVLAAASLVVLPALPAAADSPGAGGTGSASAVTAELDLHVSLLNSAVDVPVDVALNKVVSPAELHGSVLTAAVAGVAQPGPVTLVDADLGRSDTHVGADGAKASVTLANAAVHAPGLPLTALLGLQALSAEADCPVDGPPTAKVTSPVALTVLGRSVSANLYGPTHLAVPGIGTVDLEFSRRTTTSTSAAAAALVLKVALNPLNLNVAKVDGTVTVASVGCVKPTAAAGSATTPAPVASDPVVPAADASGTPAATPTKHSAPGAELASTGSPATVPLLATGAALLLGGGGALAVARRRRPAHRRH